jgi:hypothetical protein
MQTDPNPFDLLRHFSLFAVALTFVACDDTPPIGEGPLFINELMPRNTTVIEDNEGEFDDWVELYNETGSDIGLGGWFLSDDSEEPRKAELPAGLVVRAGGVLLLWCDDDTEQGPDHLPFKLAGGGEEVVLTDPEGNVIDRVEFTDLPEDISLARLSDGTADLRVCDSPTPGERNGSECD